jgi:hypothetical protein
MEPGLASASMTMDRPYTLAESLDGCPALADPFMTISELAPTNVAN